jgi:hypothetical protein
MTNNILRAVRMILLIMIVGFVGWLVYKYVVNGFADWRLIYTIIGMAFIYLITRAGLKQK